MERIGGGRSIDVNIYARIEGFHELILFWNHDGQRATTFQPFLYIFFSIFLGHLELFLKLDKDIHRRSKPLQLLGLSILC